MKGNQFGVAILKGKPTANDWAEIGKMLDEGYTSGIDRPLGINWKYLDSDEV
jgi:hypothetical protein